MTDIQTRQDYEGRTLYDSDGDKVGRITAVYSDQATGRPEWGLVHMGMFGSRSTFVPLTQMTPQGDGLSVPYQKAHIKDAPNVDAEEQISVDEEARLAHHYGLGYSTEASPTGVLEDGGAATANGGGVPTGAVGRDVSGPTTDSAMTRSEEQLRVGTLRRPSELVRLRKSVESETVSQNVPLQHEELRVEREPITDANRGAAMDGPAISEEEHEVTLMREEPVVQKEAVPVERVRVDKDVQVENREVSDDVRRERIDVERRPGG